MDVTEPILTQHHEQRRTFALLDELADDPAGLAAVWERLTILLEVHAEAEEKFFHPRLLEAGTGGGDADSHHMAEEERENVVDFRSTRTRHDIAVQFIVFENQHAARGVTPHDEDPDTYVAEHG